MKVALVSMNVKAGKCQSNFEFMKSQVQAAVEQSADMIIFPQNAISGYVLGDQWLDDKWCKEVDAYNQLIIDLSSEIAIVWGNIKYRHQMLFNCAFYAFEGHTQMRVKPNDNLGVASDARYFKENSINSIIEYKDMVFALNFGNEVQVADYNINLDARPYVYGESHKACGNMIYVNSLGIQNVGKNVMIYDGRTLINKGEKIQYCGTLFEEGMKIVDLAQDNSQEIKEASLLEALSFAIQEFDEQLFQGKLPWIIGLSGGLDSSVNAALLTHALGNKRVIAYNMATKYNSEQTKNNARTLAKALNITYHDGSIEKLVNSSCDVLQDYGYDENNWNPLVKENIQARIRGHLLASFASIEGGVVVNNGNKVEVALGYCTLYGDAIGALCPIGDLSKVQLFTLSEELNLAFHSDVIPSDLLPQISGEDLMWETPPSAELKSEQRDPMKWFYHDEIIEHLRYDISLEEYMEQYLIDKMASKPIYKWIKYYGLEDPMAFLKDMDWLKGTMKRNRFKRIQLPPLLVVSKNPYGNAYIESQSDFDESYYDSLHKKIEAMK
ncbi:MAG: NAD(+) synthase [Erysipelotrichaceae bacterium]